MSCRRLQNPAVYFFLFLIQRRTGQRTSFNGPRSTRVTKLQYVILRSPSILSVRSAFDCVLSQELLTFLFSSKSTMTPFFSTVIWLYNGVHMGGFSLDGEACDPSIWGNFPFSGTQTGSQGGAMWSLGDCFTITLWFMLQTHQYHYGFLSYFCGILSEPSRDLFSCFPSFYPLFCFPARWNARP